MTVETFIKLMKAFNNLYINFKLNEEQTKAWYGAFANYSENEFKDMLNVYMNTSEFPPLSPMSIKNKYGEQVKKQLTGKEMTADEAWNLVRGTIQIHSPYYYPEGYISYIKSRNDVAGKLAEEYLNEINGATSEALNFLATRFKQSYEILLKRKIEDNQLKLTNTSIKNLLGDGGID